MNQTCSREYSDITKLLLNLFHINGLWIWNIRSIFPFRMNKAFVTWKLNVKRIKTEKSR